MYLHFRKESHFTGLYRLWHRLWHRLWRHHSLHRYHRKRRLRLRLRMRFIVRRCECHHRLQLKSR